MEKVCNLTYNSSLVLHAAVYSYSVSVNLMQLNRVIADKSKPPLSRPKRYVPGTSSSAPKKSRFNFGECLLQQQHSTDSDHSTGDKCFVLFVCSQSLYTPRKRTGIMTRQK